jgi:hypothetical protein
MCGEIFRRCRARLALGPNCGTRSDLSVSKQSAHATFLCRFLPMVAVMQTTPAGVCNQRGLGRRLRLHYPTVRCALPRRS